jgi:predicted N-acetyltransferase YhbS
VYLLDSESTPASSLLMGEGEGRGESAKTCSVGIPACRQAGTADEINFIALFFLKHIVPCTNCQSENVRLRTSVIMAGTEAKGKIRPMEPEDIDGILEVDRKISGVKRALTYRDLVREVLGGQLDVSFVAEVEDQFVGFVLAYLTYVREQVSEACVIQIFGVDPQYQKRGIASKLIQTLMDKCHSKKIKLLRVMLEERDSELQNFFKRLGFDRGHYIDYSKIL